MTEYAANLLISKIEADRHWPPRYDDEAIATVARRAAYRESGEETLRYLHRWRTQREYLIDPIPERIALAKADLLYGEDPRVTPANRGDEVNLKRIIEVSDFASELHWGEQVRASEGEIWYRIQAKQEVGTAVPTFHSREQVVPLFVGSILTACAFVSEYEDPTTTGRRSGRPSYWRHLEIHSLGRVENRLYKGSGDHLGNAQDLDAFSETADLDTVWETGLGVILAGRVINRRGRNRTLGRSDYQGVENLFLALNEAMTIGVENARLTAKKRAVVPPSAVEPTRSADLPPASVDVGDGGRMPFTAASFDAGEDLLVAGGLDTDLGKEPGAGLFKVLEYRFDAEALIAWQDALVKTVASRCGLTVEFLGAGQNAGQGSAETGTALRVRLLPATSSSRGSGRAWDDALPAILLKCQLLDSMPQSAGGFGRSYRAAGDPPSVERTDPLPRDEGGEITANIAATGGPVRSIEEAVRRLNPDKEESWIKEEVESIRSDLKASREIPGFGPPESDDPESGPGNLPEPGEDA